MATSTHLSLEEFEARYGASKTHEYWCSEAIPKSVPTWLHGKIQKIIASLLDEAGLVAATEVELRILENSRPRPDVIAVLEEPTEQYPTTAPDVIVEIISPDDKPGVVAEHCRMYEEWGCPAIYLVYPQERRVVRWTRGSEILSSELAGIPVLRIWDKVDRKPR